EDKKQLEIVTSRNQLDSLLHSVQKSLKEYGDKISADEKAKIEAAVKDAEEAMKSEDKAKIDARAQALGQAAQKLGEKIYADEEVIKKAYRRLAMKHHPDRNPDNPKAEELFKEAKEAYETLTDANKRAAYDRYGHAGVDPRAGMAGGGAAGFSGFADAFGDIFGDIFNQARGGRSSVYRGADLRYNLEVGLEQAARGTETRIRIPTY